MRLSHVIGMLHAVSTLWLVLCEEVQGRAVEAKTVVLAAEAECAADETHAVDARRQWHFSQFQPTKSGDVD